MEYLSTTSLAKEMDIPGKELFEKLQGLGLITRNGDKWVLTDLGRSKGGQTRTNPKFGEFIVWPEDVSFDGPSTRGNYMNATSLGKHFKLSNQRMNLVLAELGLLEKNVAGWAVTKLGRSLGGRQMELDSGATYVIWPPTLLENKRLLDVVRPQEPQAPPSAPTTSTAPTIVPGSDAAAPNGFRGKFEAKYRTTDGHYVRSRAELVIDNWLYTYGIVHAYERRLPIEEECYCDFYIPQGAGRPQAVYIEFWGMEEDAKYAERKKKKLAIYEQNEFPLIQLTNADIDNLDDTLPPKLLKHKIKVG